MTDEFDGDAVLRDEWQRVRPPADRVPRRPPATDWRALAAKARRPLRFTTTSVTEDGLTTTTEPVSMSVPDWSGVPLPGDGQGET